ncbi:MAG: pyridine nucleotide-disulfide oxidoreductase [Spirochaetae bacterium HGW-Spirochaetae-3]|nr:MAG: pyridine nucleotide-disulfide oxidoreductase [Spirochaetae bacterium HGW-Spirochaetae-3]
MAKRPLIMKLACKISIESLTYTGITVEDPEYRILDPVVTDDMAEVGLGLKVRKWLTVADVARNVGKPEEHCAEQLLKLADAGVCKIAKHDGEDKCFLPIWVPGIMECMVANTANAERYPVLGECFEDYTRRRTQMLAPNLPVGNGLMRVIPVEKAISGETVTRSFEEVSNYVENAYMLAVSDCTCRRSRRLMGEGCGHLETDMCIQLDDGAEFFVRTGKARQIDKEEAYEILRRAEDNGLVHQTPNLDGPGKTLAICNCCGCSCFALRVSEYYNAFDFSRSNYGAKVDPEKCVACGQCVENCQVNAVKLGQKLCSKTPVVTEFKHEHPRDTMWGPDKWNPDYRTTRVDVVESGTSPCKTNCPAHIGIQGYVKLAAQGKYREALELIKKENPFPAVCGRICNRRCEDACTRGDIDEPVAIDEIKKFIAQRDLDARTRYVPPMLNTIGKPYPQKVAVVGAGPAGLSCAFYLAQKGYPVTVYEKEKKLGGMLMLGIPSFRLEKDVVEAEIDVLREMGVAFKTGVEVGKDVTLDQLRAEGYKAFYMAIGAQGGRRIGIPGEDAEGAVAGVDFLRDINLGKEAMLDGDVVVIGGGNVAIDVARTAVRAGAKTVSMFCLETRDIMPASVDEIEEAEAEGIVIHNAWGPREIIQGGGKVKSVVFKKCVKVFDADRRFNPAYDEKETKTVDCDKVLLTVGQSIQWGALLEGTKVELNRNDTVKADAFTYQTAHSDIFAGGDAFTGPKFAIDAIAAGKEAAISIHRFVQPGQSLVIGRDRKQYKELDKKNADLESYDSMPRQRPVGETAATAKGTFRDLRGTLSEEQVKKETERCLGCGASIVDEYMCVGCGICTTKCQFDAIQLVRKSDAVGGVFEKAVIGVVAPNMLKRGGRIAAKGITGQFTVKGK